MSFRSRFCSVAALSALLAIASFSERANAGLVGQFVLNGATVPGESALPGYDDGDWSDLQSMSLVVERGTEGGFSTGPTSASFRFSLPTSVALPGLAQGFNENQVFEGTILAIDPTVDSQFEEPIQERYEFEQSRITGLSVDYRLGPPGVVTAVIALNRISITNEESGFETLLDFTSVAGLNPIPGDFSGDGFADEADYDKWAGDYGAIMLNLGGGADANTDGLIDAADFTLWRDAAAASSGSAATPEPSGLVMLLSGGVATVSRLRR